MRKVLMGLLAAALLVFPAAASAQGRAPTPFTAQGVLCVAELPTSIDFQPIGPGGLLTGSGEVLEGSIVSSDGWADLVGADVRVEITHERDVVNFLTGALRGTLAAEIGIQGGVGGVDLSGDLGGRIAGQLDTALLPDLLAAIVATTTDVTWALGGEGVSAKGLGHAEFSVDHPLSEATGSFCGDITFTGARS